jgi:hypothetical protein
MSDQKVPQAPDYSPMINAYNGISNHAQSQGEEAMKWAKDQVANNQNLVNHVNNGLLDLQGNFTDAAGKRLAAASGLQDDATKYLTDQRERFADPRYVANDMGAAEANVGQAADAARNNHIQQLESYGVNPGATRFGALNISSNMQEAAAKASAGTGAARADQARADQANAQLLGQGNTEAGQANANAATGASAGTAATSGNLAQTASGANVLGTDLAWTGTRANALTGAVNAQNTGFQNTAKSDEISNSSSSGLGSLLGTGLSAFGKGGALSGAMAFLAEGGSVPGAGNPGGAIPDAASPSNGAVVDDVPATAPGAPPIRLNGGEFVIPRDVAAWEGEKGLQALIQKARAAMQKAQAKPAVGPAAAAQQPQQGAIPAGPMAYAGGGAVPTPRPRPEGAPRRLEPFPQPRPATAPHERFKDFRRSEDIIDRRDYPGVYGRSRPSVYSEEELRTKRPGALAIDGGALDLDRHIGEAMLRDLMPEQKKYGWPGPGTTMRDDMGGTGQ